MLSSQLEQYRRQYNASLLAELGEQGCLRGHLSSSALATAVACIALQRVDAETYQEEIQRATAWLANNPNADGGWGDTTSSPSNPSTTLLVWSALEKLHPRRFTETRQDAASRLAKEFGSCEAQALTRGILKRYGNDRTFSVPILTFCALNGTLGPEPECWRHVPQLPFELALAPASLYRFLGLPVVSYALPALIAIGLVRHRRNRGGGIRGWLTPRVLRKLAAIQPENGGFLEAAPLTGFVTLSLASCGFHDHPITQLGVDFLKNSQRSDGSWPIDTDLASWLTNLGINAADQLPEPLIPKLRAHLLQTQFNVTHPFTNARPGGWAWSDKPGAVPDADDTAMALLALSRLTPLDQKTVDAGRQGIAWLLKIQNRNGGFPTFCRGWGKLPFDASCPDITIHALSAFTAWRDALLPKQRKKVASAVARALLYLERTQQEDGAWLPLWFGNDQAPNGENKLYGTASVVAGLRDIRAFPNLIESGSVWLLKNQNQDGGWGGMRDCPSTLEETALALDALAGMEGVEDCLQKGMSWLENALPESREPTPIGLYFAKLWYHEREYLRLFILKALNHLAE